MKIMLLGATGVLGTALKKNINLRKSKITSCGFSSKADLNFDALKKNNLKKYINKIKPNVIINCIVNRDVNKCIKDFFFGYNLNIKVCKAIISEIIGKKIHLIHFSTDQVYNNKTKNRKFVQRIDPINNYGLTKYIGENIVLAHKYSTIIRTNFYNNKLTENQSFSEWIVKNLKNNRKINLPYNNIFNPISTDNLSNIVSKIIKFKVYGTYDIGSNEVYSKYKFAMKIANKYNLNTKLIKKYKNFPQISMRSNNTYLDNKKIERKLNIKINNELI